MLLVLIILINLLILYVSQSFSHDLPDYFPRCALYDSELNNCIARAANTLRPYIRKGIKEIKFPSLEPFVIPRFDIIQESHLANYTAMLWNYTIQGLDNYDITEIRYDPKFMTFKGIIEFDSVAISSVYTMKGSLLSISMEGNGTLRADYGLVNATFEINGNIIKRKDIDYYKPIKTVVKLVSKDSSYYFGGLFNGNEQLERFVNNMINRNSKRITEGVTPAFESLAEKGLMFLIKSLTDYVPYEKLFLLSYK